LSEEPITLETTERKPGAPLILHPAIFLAGWLLLGTLFAFQDYVMARSLGYRPRFRLLVAAEGLHFLLWGTICRIIWWKLKDLIQDGTFTKIFLRLLPLSILVGFSEEALWVAVFPHGVFPNPKWTYWHTLKSYEYSELVNNLVIFWGAVALFRAIGYYQRLRENETAAVRMQAEMTNAQLRALRMQLNPHFLFNSMNSVSSLMRTDVEAADVMLERMSCMLRMSLDRGDARLIPLTEEIEFIQLYLSIQKMRFQGTVHHYIAIDPDVLDALVPTMILQPIVENAYLHGVARTVGEAFLGIEAQNHDGQLRLCVRNSGRGIGRVLPERKSVGIANVKARLELYYGRAQSFTLQECSEGEVQAILMLPLEISLLPGRSQVEQVYGD
jgi:two-component system, LytTR family, sensor kinase